MAPRQRAATERMSDAPYKTRTQSLFVAGYGSRTIGGHALGGDTQAPEFLAKVAEKARNHEVDQGFSNAMNLKMNDWAEPLLEQPQLKEVLRRIER